MGNNSSSTIAYGGFFRFQSFSLILTLSFHEIQRIHCEQPMPNLKAWEVEQSKQFFERVPGVGLGGWCLMVLPWELPHEWLHTLSLQHSLFLSQTTDSFLERIPGLGLRGWCLVVLPWELPREWLHFPNLVRQSPIHISFSF